MYNKNSLTALMICSIFICSPTTVSAAPPPLDFTVNLSEPVVVDTTGGTPSIPITVDNTTSAATFLSGSGTNTLTFRYSPTAGDLDLNGIALGSSISLNSGTIKDTAGNNATLTFTAPNTSNVKIDYPSLSLDFTNGSTGRYTRNGQAYTSLSSFLSDAGGTFSRASTATYFDSTGTMQTAATNAPRFDYDPSTLTLKGLLIEEQRTNYIRNGSALGGVVGTPGTLPSYWHEVVTPASLNYQVISTGTENGIPYIDLRIYGTASSAYPAFYFEPSNQITAATGQTWTLSTYIKQVAGNMSGINNISLRVVERNSSGGITMTNEAVVTVPTSGDLSTARLTKTFTFSGGINTAYAHPGVRLNVNTGTPIDITLRVGAAQLELAPFATSYIPTTGASTTRSADSLTIPAGTWFNASHGTMTTQSIIPRLGGTVYPGTISLDDGSGGNSIHLFISDASSDNKASEIFNGGSTQFSSFGSAYTAGSTLKQAVSFTNNRARASMDGTLGTLDTSITLPTVTTLRIGSRRSGADPLNGWIQKAKYYPLQVTDTQLQLLTQ